MWVYGGSSVLRLEIQKEACQDIKRQRSRIIEKKLLENC